MPDGFVVKYLRAHRLRHRGAVGQVEAGLTGRFLGEGFGFVVAESSEFARAALADVVKASHGVPAHDSLPGAYRFAYYGVGASTPCGVAGERCYESARVVRVANVIVFAVVQASKPITTALTNRVVALLPLLIRKLQAAGG